MVISEHEYNEKKNPQSTTGIEKANGSLLFFCEIAVSYYDTLLFANAIV